MYLIYLAASGLTCGTRAQYLWRTGLVACGILDPQPGIEPMSLALEGRFLTTGPREKSLSGCLTHCLIELFVFLLL